MTYLNIPEAKRLYVDEQLSSAEVAHRLGTTRPTLLKALRGAGIDIRSPGRRASWTLLKSKEWLEDRYEKVPATAIAEELGCHCMTVFYWLDKHDIQKRTLSEAHQKTYDDGFVNPNPVKWSEDQRREISRRFKRWRKKHPEHQAKIIAALQTPETKKRISDAISGEKHYNWRGGSSKYKYPMEFSRALKARIRERDSHTCQLCQKTEDELQRTLAIHHIDYDRTNNTESNLIALCATCHAQTNFNRTSWFELFSKAA